MHHDGYDIYTFWDIMSHFEDEHARLSLPIYVFSSFSFFFFTFRFVDSPQHTARVPLQRVNLCDFTMQMKAMVFVDWTRGCECIVISSFFLLTVDSEKMAGDIMAGNGSHFQTAFKTKWCKFLLFPTFNLMSLTFFLSKKVLSKITPF